MEAEEEFEREGDWKGPLKVILALIMTLMLILMVVPSNFISRNPEPKDIPPMEFNASGEPLESLQEVILLEISPTVRNAALRINTKSCHKYSKICYSKALFYYVRDNIRYINDPREREYIQGPKETLGAAAGDCEDQSILLYIMLKSIGITPRIVSIPGHVYIEILLPEASGRYKNEHGWINMDPTCSGCSFGEIPRQNVDKPRRYIT